MSVLLKPVELLYRAVNRRRREMYREGKLTSRLLPRPVVSVGNTAIGGSGKTPAVIALARLLGERGKKVAVLTRGYGRKDARTGGLVTEQDAERFGDEPVLIARRAPEADVIVGSNRYRAADEYLGSHHCDVFLLDDGFQHLQLARDVDIVLENRSAKWYRESDDALRDADIIVTRGEGEFVATTHVETFVWHGEPRPIGELAAFRVAAFAGLADNAQFFSSLERLGVNLVLAAEFGDHHRYSRADLDWLRAEMRTCRADVLVTTEKDWVKIQDPEIAYVELEMRFNDAFVERLLQMLNDGRG